MGVAPRRSPAWPACLAGVASAEWALLAMLVALLARGGIVPGWKLLHTDFENYYVAARLHRLGVPIDRVYDWVWFQRQKDHLGVGPGVVSYAPITPFSALVLEPLVSLSALAAKRCWLVIDVLFLGATVALLRGMVRLPVRRVAIIALLAIAPLQSDFKFGQQYVFILFLVTLSGRLFLRGQESAAAIGLACASLLKLYPALLAVFFLLHRRWRAFGVFVGATAGLALLGSALLGRDVMWTYLCRVLPRALAGEINDPYYLPSSSITVLLRRLFVFEPDLNPSPLARAPVAFVVLQPLAQAALLMSALWVLSPLERARDGGKALWGAFAVMPLVLSTATSTYHYCLMVLATVLMVDLLVGRGRVREAVALVGLHAVVCSNLQHLAPESPSGWAILLGAPRLLALLAYWGVCLWAVALTDAPHRPAWHRFAFAAAFAGLVAAGVGAGVSRLGALVADGDARLSTKSDVFMASSPADAPEGVYFSRMQDDGFMLDRTRSWSAPAAYGAADLLHPTVSRETGNGWVEISSRTSRVVRFSLGAREIAPETLPIEDEDAEQPTVSADGRRLGFLREEHGRRSLWVKEVGASASAPARQVLDASRDVVDFAFLPAGRIVFAGRRGARVDLYIATSSGADLVALRSPDGSSGSARYPAVSPDGRWLAYSEERHGSWQLRVRDLATADERVLTPTGCNSISPAWESDSKAVVYATDCGRGLGVTALARTALP